MIDYVEGFLEINRLLKLAHNAMLKQRPEEACQHLSELRRVAAVTDEKIAKQYNLLSKA